MSATIEQRLFSEYFARPVAGQPECAPVLKLDGRAYDVAEYYLEDLKDLGKVSSSSGGSSGSSGSGSGWIDYTFCRQCIIVVVVLIVVVVVVAVVVAAGSLQLVFCIKTGFDLCWYCHVWNIGIRVGGGTLFQQFLVSTVVCCAL